MDRVFLRFIGGAVDLYRQPVIDRPVLGAACYCHGEVCYGTACDCLECRKQMEKEVITATFMSVPAQATQEDPPPGKVDLSGLEMLRYIPDIPREMFARLLHRNNMVQCIRSMARIAPLFAPAGVRQALGWSKEALKKHKAVRQRSRTVNVLGTLELNPKILRFGFLTIIKASQKQYPPTPRGKVATCHGMVV